MEMKPMIDTWGWLTLRDRRETWHNEVNFRKHVLLKIFQIKPQQSLLEKWA